MSLCESQKIVPTFHDNPLGWKTRTGLEISLPGIMYLIVFLAISMNNTRSNIV